MAKPALRLRDFGVGVRLALTLLALLVVFGCAASGLYMKKFQENRDERPGFTFDDIRAHYHGLTTYPPMLKALESGHPPELPQRERDALISWLKSDRLAQDYDNFDLGDLAPEEIIVGNCVSCHARSATGPDAMPKMSLEYFDDVRALSISRTIKPVDEKILYASLHTHVLGLASLTIVVLGLLALTRLPGVIVGLVSVVTAVGLCADLGAWVPARQHAVLVEVILVGGIAYQIGLVAALVLVVCDLWWPKARASQA
ncbi:MAG: hypothetical protein KF757_12495 [Phycisphaeraceae bacterium]|nr:hypothetical protein [Phycisphaeraceae bacterium]MCW5762534.1 hypothetical protein [Phycisphaeraceae bacterium]